MCQVMDKSPSLFSPTNLGIYSESIGKGIQKGALIKSISVAGSNANTFGVEVVAAVPTGATGNVYGASISAYSSGSPLSYGVKAEAGGSSSNYGGNFGSYNQGLHTN